MKIEKVRKLSKGHFEVYIIYNFVFFKRVVRKYVYGYHDQYYWMESCKRVDKDINIIFTWLEYLPIEYIYNGDSFSEEKQQIIKEKSEQEKIDNEL